MFKIDKIEVGDLMIEIDETVYERSLWYVFEYWKIINIHDRIKAMDEAEKRNVVLWEAKWWTDHAVMTIRDYLAVYIPPHKMKLWNLKLTKKGEYKRK